MIHSGPGNTSIWEDTAPTPEYPALDKDIQVDVAVIGAGITGLTAALSLQKQGKNVVIIEGDWVGSGTSGKTTAHLTTLFDHSYDVLESKYDEETSRLVAKSMVEAIDLIEGFQTDLNIDCDFERLSGYYYAEEDQDSRDVDKVFQASKKAELDVRKSEKVPLPFKTVNGFEIKNQAQFHSLKYLQGLAAAFTERGGQLFENTRVLSVSSGSPCKISTEDAKITATDVVMATHTPIGFNVIHSEVAPYRSYVIAAKVRGEAPVGLFWDTCEPYHYIRTQNTEDGPLVIIGGKDRKVGHGKEADSFVQLQEYIRKRFDVERFVYQWSAQFYDPADHLPFIGLIPFSGHVYTGTGYSGDGLTFGTLAGHMIAEQIAGRKTAYDDLYKPGRVNSEGLPSFVKENLDVAKGLVLDRLLPGSSSNLESLPAGEGRVFRSGVSKYAAYRDSEGEVAVFSAVCPHMKCIVRWNSAHKSFDCPCHGSRFDTSGEVIEGPSLQCLAKVDLSDLEKKEKPRKREQPSSQPHL